MNEIYKNKIFRLYASCIPVKGHSRSIILDMDRTIYYLIPNSLFDIIDTYSNKNISD